MIKYFLLVTSFFISLNSENLNIMQNIMIETKKAPAPIGPYSQAILANNILFISGQIPFDIQKKEIVNDIKEATKLIMSYLEAILNEANMKFENVVKTTIYLVDMNDFAAVNEIYGSFFKNNYFPARKTVQVAGLPKNSRVEISMIAIKNS